MRCAGAQRESGSVPPAAGGVVLHIVARAQKSDPRHATARQAKHFRSSARRGHAMAKNTICIWYDREAETAARFYAKTFPDSAVGAIWRAPGDYPSGKKGDVLVVEFK